MKFPSLRVTDPLCQRNWEAVSKYTFREVRGVAVATYGGVTQYAISTPITHGLGTTPHVICSIAEYFELGSPLASAQPYAVNSTTFSIIVTVNGAAPAAGTVAHLNYIAWV